MHYKNGREAKQGDVVVCLAPHNQTMGILYNLNSQSTTCNGRLAQTKQNDAYVTLSDCVHIDDVATSITKTS